VFGLHRLLLPAALLALVWLAPSAEAANVKAKTSLQTKSGETRIVAKLSSKNRLGARKRPRKVRVKAGGNTYRLKRVRGGASAARVNLGTWRSAAYRGSDAQALLDLVGERVRLIVSSRAGKTTLRPKLAPPAGSTPAPGEGDPPPGEGDPPPGGGDLPPPDDGGGGDITGQQAIDTMTEAMRNGAVRYFRNQDDISDTFELHLCGDGQFRWYQHTSSSLGPMATEKYGQPWTVVEALIKADGSYRGARVQGTFTYQRRLSGAEGQINEPAEAVIEQLNGQWYWDQEPVEVFDASCAPAF